MGRGGWEWNSVRQLSPAAVTATMGSVHRSAWGLRAGLRGTRRRTIPFRGNRPGMLLSPPCDKNVWNRISRKTRLPGLITERLPPLLDELTPLIEQLLPFLFPPESGFYKGRIFYNLITMECFFLAPEYN